MVLTTVAVKQAKPEFKTRRLYDERGLYLEISPAGSKYWRLKYRINGREKRLALGVYPEVSLKDARLKRDEARQLLASDVDPSARKKAIKASKAAAGQNTFEVIGREWFALYEKTWSDGHRKRVDRQLNKDLFPWIGHLPIDQLEAPALLECLKRIEKRGAINSAHKTRGVASQVFAYAISKGSAKINPARDLSAALKPADGENFPALTDPKDVVRLMKAIEDFEGSFVVASALKLAPLFFVRPGTLRHAEWSEFDFDAAQWTSKLTKTERRARQSQNGMTTTLIVDLPVFCGQLMAPL